MAINDLISELGKDTNVDEMTQKRLSVSMLKALQDTNGDVQNIAVKRLVPQIRGLIAKV
jgi:hypothetical protein